MGESLGMIGLGGGSTLLIATLFSISVVSTLKFSLKSSAIFYTGMVLLCSHSPGDMVFSLFDEYTISLSIF